jgi:hypothetical protein
MFEYSVQYCVNGQWGSSYPCFGRTKESALASLLKRVGYLHGASRILRVRDYQNNCIWLTSKRKNSHGKRQWYSISVNS